MGGVRDVRFKKYTSLTVVFLLIGGMCLGPIVQLYAFGDLWTGVPFGWDLTDNKTLIAFIFWLIALVYNRKHDKPLWSLIAAIVLMVIYTIPHSVMGSTFSYESGEVVTGAINTLSIIR